MTLSDLLQPTFDASARAVALEWRCERLTFADLDARANRLAHVLTRRGLTRGDRLAVYLANRVEYVDLVLAAARVGIVLVPVNVLYRERELQHIVSDSTPKAIVTADPPPGGIAGAPAWDIEVLSEESSTQPSSRRQCPHFDGDAPAALIYTSGTTGAAKGAILTHNNFACNAVNLVTCWRFTAADRLLLALPLFHVHGLGNGLMCWLLSGCRMRLLERFEHQSAAGAFLDFRPTVFFGVPTMYVRMLEIDENAARRIGAGLRLCVSGSAPLPAQVLEEFEARFRQRILERYGMTETMMTLSNPYAGERRAGTVGHPLPGVSVRVCDDSGADVAAGSTGELLVRSPTLCAGYWNRPDATAAAFDGGWFHTGDVAEMSADGYITLRGRRTDLIISGGFNVYPREIEEVLAEHPAVAEAAVVGRPDAVRGEIPEAFVVVRPGYEPDAEALVLHCRSQLASFKVPKEVHFVPRLPRTALGKVQKQLLARQ